MDNIVAAIGIFVLLAFCLYGVLYCTVISKIETKYKIVESRGKYIVKEKVLMFWKKSQGYAGFPCQFYDAVYDNKKDAEKFIARRRL